MGILPTPLRTQEQSHTRDAPRSQISKNHNEMDFKRLSRVDKPKGSDQGACNAGIFLVRAKENGMIFVEKQFHPEEVAEGFASREIKALNELNHPNIVKLAGADLDREKLSASLYMQHCRLSSVDVVGLKYRERDEHVPEGFLWHVFYSCVSAFAYAHHGASVSTESGRPVITPHTARRPWNFYAHRDLKPGNIFLDHVGPEPPKLPFTSQYPQVLIGDFGCCGSREWLESGEQVPDYITRQAPGFGCPEGSEWSTESDIYQLGLVIHCLSWNITGPKKGVNTIVNNAVNPRYSSKLASLVRDCLQKSKWGRPSALNLVEPVFDGYMRYRAKREGRIRPLASWSLPGPVQEPEELRDERDSWRQSTGSPQSELTDSSAVPSGPSTSRRTSRAASVAWSSDGFEKRQSLRSSIADFLVGRPTDQATPASSSPRTSTLEARPRQTSISSRVPPPKLHVDTSAGRKHARSPRSSPVEAQDLYPQWDPRPMPTRQPSEVPRPSRRTSSFTSPHKPPAPPAPPLRRSRASISRASPAHPPVCDPPPPTFRRASESRVPSDMSSTSSRYRASSSSRGSFDRDPLYADREPIRPVPKPQNFFARMRTGRDRSDMPADHTLIERERFRESFEGFGGWGRACQR